MQNVAKTAGISLLLIASLSFFVMVIYNLPISGDWRFFYRASQHISNPYEVNGFFNPPWLAWLLYPFGLIPQQLAFALWITISTITIIGSMRVMGGGIAATLLVLLSPAYIRFITSGQMDALPLLGFALLTLGMFPHLQGVGAVLISTKPQTLGFGFIAYWLMLDRKGKIKVLVIPTGVLLLSFAIYGWWPAKLELSTINSSVNIGIWPYGIPIGIVLFFLAVRKKQIHIAALATIFLTPYLAPYSIVAYLAVLFTFIPIWLAVVIDIALWVLIV